MIQSEVRTNKTHFYSKVLHKTSFWKRVFGICKWPVFLTLKHLHTLRVRHLVKGALIFTNACKQTTKTILWHKKNKLPVLPDNPAAASTRTDLISPVKKKVTWQSNKPQHVTLIFRFGASVKSEKNIYITSDRSNDINSNLTIDNFSRTKLSLTLFSDTSS